MAESQETFSYSAEALVDLNRTISLPRLAPYLKEAAGDEVMALKMYLWNARLAKSFLYPLQMTEVCIRNSMHAAFAQQYRTRGWIFSPAFPLTQQSRASHTTAYSRLLRHKPQPTADDFVAGLSFDFWSNLYRDDYEIVWLTPGLLSSTFPLLPANVDRPRIKHLVSRINYLRNRIAHHEPIHAMKLTLYLDDVRELLSYLCDKTLKWVETNATVKQAIYSKPLAGSEFVGTPLSLAKHRAPPVIGAGTSLLDAMKAVEAGRPRSALVANPERTPAYDLLTPSMITAYVQQNALSLGGMIDLNEHTASNVIESTDRLALSSIDVRMSSGDLKAIFYPRISKADKKAGKGPRAPGAVLIMDPSRQLEPVGIAFKPDVKL